MSSMRFAPISTRARKVPMGSGCCSSPRRHAMRKIVRFALSIARPGTSGRWRRTSGSRTRTALPVQQWVSNGRRVVFHGERKGEWFVAAVDLDSVTERVLASGRLSGSRRAITATN